MLSGPNVAKGCLLGPGTAIALGRPTTWPALVGWTWSLLRVQQSKQCRRVQLYMHVLCLKKMHESTQGLRRAWPRPKPLGGWGNPMIPPPPWSPVIMYPSGELNSFPACVPPLGGGECDEISRRSTDALDR